MTGDRPLSALTPGVLIGSLNGKRHDYESLNYTNQSNSSHYSFDLRIMVDMSGMIDLGCKGLKYSNHKKMLQSHGVPNMKRVRLDRALAFVDCHLKFPNAITKNMQPIVLDHRLILLDTTEGTNNQVKQFKYEYMWVRDPRCFWVVKSAWSGRLHHNPMINFNQKQKKARSRLAKWNRTHFRDVKKQIEEAQLCLEEIENSEPTNVLCIEAAKPELNESLHREEFLWKQKSRVPWLKEGDKCTKLFMASIVNRRR
ncbi:uncharacterized protein LOC133777434 [Humulus lupulus]|uniref:uncharacterized protein LOC133777434 n=1 Tax=Humulus lupulus TaxID=3486 RepID=UPI002B416F48|nr:uncharacterized protein LOC133777434 [Humulus lupulus]